MTTERRPERSLPSWIVRARSASVAVLYVGATALVVSLWLLHGPHRFNAAPQASLERVLHGGATRPFSSRVLAPYVAAAVGEILPFDARAIAMERPRAGRLLAHLGAQPDLAPTIVGAVVVAFASMLAWMALFRVLVADLYPGQPRVVRDVAPLVAALGLPLLWVSGGRFLYDPVSVLVATAGLVLIARERWRALVPVLFLGALNHETVVVLPIVFLAYHLALGSGTRRSLAAAFGWQAAAVAAGRGLGILVAKSDPNPGVFNDWLRDYFPANVVAAWRAPMWYDAPAFASALLFWILFTLRWARKPLVLRCSLVVAALTIGPLYLYGGIWGEIRVFFPAFPAMAALALDSLWRLGAGDDAVERWLATEPVAEADPLRILAETVLLIAAGLFLTYGGYTVWAAYAGA